MFDMPLSVCIKLLALSGEGAAGPNQLIPQTAIEELQGRVLLTTKYI